MNSPDEPSWFQHHLHLAGPTAEIHAARYLGPALAALEGNAVIATWHFLRKGDRWRLRFQPAGTAEGATGTTAVEEALEQCRDAGMITAWTTVVYEPETRAFGGLEGMDAAHRLFHLDSRCALAYLRAVHTGQLPDQRRELAVLLGVAAMRAAGLDWYEIGDTWVKVAENRPTTTAGGSRLRDSVRTLLSTDTGPDSALVSGGRLAFAAEWFEAFGDYGRGLRKLNDSGRLQRGLRRVLAHQQLFHANRLGLSHEEQALLAGSAATAVLDLYSTPGAAP
ncbi:thiopeptide-type bacteriocin biosynthesis protein [Kitasatospora sp. NPDC048545]|uniref:thiopeptide-type bacteriocin biosynthesis protein n=1 Tax=Kitasatospora sp. NPDC048545 TaxID=3157208 RepID=UPI0033E8F4DB